MAKPQHIVCIKSSLVEHRSGGFVDYTLEHKDLMLGVRDTLEDDPDFRQVCPITVFLHEGKVWAYRRTGSGGESRLHDKVTVCVGGHWDQEDLAWNGSVCDLPASLKNTVERELEEEVKVGNNILEMYQLPKMICADDTPVDQVHIAPVTIVVLDGTDVDSNEEDLDTIGFLSPQELLEGDYNLETWGRLVCELLVNQ